MSTRTDSDVTTPARLLQAQAPAPEFELSAEAATAFADADVVAFPVFAPEQSADDETAPSVLLPAQAQELVDESGLDLLALLAAESDPSAPGAVTTVPVYRSGGVQLMLLIGVGDGAGAALRRAGAALARATMDRDTVVTAIPALTDSERGLADFVAGAVLGSFSFQWRSEGPQQRPPARIVLAGSADAEAEAELAKAVAVADAARLARMLASVPSNVKTPAWMAEQAERVGADAGLKVEVWEPEQLRKAGMGGILGVGRASAAPPRLIRLDYTPPKGGRRAPRIVLVGKGITFDSGGLSIKPAESMATMKRDMTGGAVVISVLGALAAVGCPVRVTGLVATAENAISGDALRPGDVIRHYGGRTSEVTNTDAEGRLVMADALAYAVDKLSPAALVDVATLTGAIKVSLGQGIGGLFANDDGLARHLLAAGTESGEPVWRMPLADDYESFLSSKVADADNAPGGPGAIIAALFLQHFTGTVPWAHLDVASVGDAPKDAFEWTAGPTGYGVRLLLEWLGSDKPLADIG